MNAFTMTLVSTAVLFGLVVVSALSVVSNIDDRRQLFSAIQVHGHNRAQADSNWRQLLLEQAAQSSQVMVDSVAHERLQMGLPERNSTIVVN